MKKLMLRLLILSGMVLSFGVSLCSEKGKEMVPAPKGVGSKGRSGISSIIHKLVREKSGIFDFWILGTQYIDVQSFEKNERVLVVVRTPGPLSENLVDEIVKELYEEGAIKRGDYIVFGAAGKYTSLGDAFRKGKLGFYSMVTPSKEGVTIASLTGKQGPSIDAAFMIEEGGSKAEIKEIHEETDKEKKIIVVSRRFPLVKSIALLASMGLLFGAAYLYQNPEVAEKLQQRSLELYGQYMAPLFAAAREGFGGYASKFTEQVGFYWPFKR